MSEAEAQQKNTISDKDAAWVKQYAEAVNKKYLENFKDDGRFEDWKVLINRFDEAIKSTLKNGLTHFSGADEAHNELCIAASLLANKNSKFARLDYEPKLNGCEQSIDFRAVLDDGPEVFVDVKTIQPSFKDRWDQYDKAQEEKWLPDNVRIILAKDWLGGELWHAKFASRSRMLEYTQQLEKKANISKISNG